MSEEWRPIDGFLDYEVSSFGRVRRIVESCKGHQPKILRPWVNNMGYYIVTVCGASGAKRKQVSRLVCAAFHGSAPTEEYDAAHGDGNPSNNTANNLRWATRKENMADTLLHGTRAMGSKHGRTTKPERTPRGSVHGHAKLTEENVAAIRAAPKINGSGRALARMFGVSPSAICLIRSNKNWRHL